MTGRKSLAAVAAAAALLGLAACATAGHTPATQASDVEFLRGCWVAKTAPGGKVTGFLRLLPEGAAGVAYQGQVGGMEDGRSGPSFSFRRDGSVAEVVHPVGAPHKIYHKTRYDLLLQGDGTTYAAYAEEGAPGNRLIAEATGEQLTIHALASKGKDSVLFNGERDGCD